MAIGFYFALINRFDQENHSVPRHVDTEMADDPICQYERSEAHDKTIEISGERVTVPAYSGLVEKGVRRNGRSGVHHFDFFYEPFNFVFYKVLSMNLIAFATGKDPSRQFIKKLSRDSSATIRLSEIEVDLSQAAATIPNISGAWISGLRANNPYLSTLGVFGTRVTNSNEYQQAITQGAVSAITFTHQFNGISRVSGLSKNGSIFIFERINNAAGIPNTAAELSFMLDVYQQHIAGLAVPR